MAKFTDIESHWSRADIEFLADMGLMGGYPDGTFRPDAPITRAEYASARRREIQNMMALWTWNQLRLRDRVAPAVIHIETRTGLGSGVLISPTGLVVTCDHVTGDAAAPICSFPSWSDAAGATPFLEVLTRRPEEDLALCRVSWGAVADRRGFPFLQNSPDELKPGSSVVVVGSSSGVPAWESMGIVARPSVVSNYYQQAQVLMALSAAVNPGNSGGAVVAMATGELEGIASMKLVDTTIEGMAFAIPAASVERLVADALLTGKIVPAELERAA